MSAYQELVKEAKKLGWPTHYEADLYKHDKEFCRKNKEMPFIWMIRPYGTHLAATSFWTKEAIQSGIETVKYFSTGMGRGEGTKFFHWNGWNLSPIDPADAIKLLEMAREKAISAEELARNTWRDLALKAGGNKFHNYSAIEVLGQIYYRGLSWDMAQKFGKLTGPKVTQLCEKLKNCWNQSQQSDVIREYLGIKD